MSETIPLAHRTAERRARLRCALLGAALVFGPTGPVLARSAPVRVLVSAPVSDAARPTMSPTLWAKMVSDWVSATVIPFAGEQPTLDDCHKAGADFLVSAPFELRPRLPGMPNVGGGRVAARSHIVITNCFTGAVGYDQTVNFDSDPSSAGAGDLESSPEITWSRNVPATLGKYPVFFPHVARIFAVRPPIVLVDLRQGVNPGDVLRIFAGADHKAKGPIYLTVTQTQGKYVEAMYSSVTGGPQPAVGDFVEPVAKPSP
jgi:hypothetical protein